MLSRLGVSRERHLNSMQHHSVKVLLDFIMVKNLINQVLYIQPLMLIKRLIK